MAATVPNHDLDGFIKSMTEDVHGAFKRGVKYGRYLEQQERPVRHGKWNKLAENCHVCSACYKASPYDYHYCPECGAKMDGQNAPARKCATCQHTGWDMPQCRVCNEKNGFKWYKEVKK